MYGLNYGFHSRPIPRPFGSRRSPKVREVSGEDFRRYCRLRRCFRCFQPFDTFFVTGLPRFIQCERDNLLILNINRLKNDPHERLNEEIHLAIIGRFS